MFRAPLLSRPSCVGFLGMLLVSGRVMAAEKAAEGPLLPPPVSSPAELKEQESRSLVDEDLSRWKLDLSELGPTASILFSFTYGGNSSAELLG